MLILHDIAQFFNTVKHQDSYNYPVTETSPRTWPQQRHLQSPCLGTFSAHSIPYPTLSPMSPLSFQYPSMLSIHCTGSLPLHPHPLACSHMLFIVVILLHSHHMSIPSQCTYSISPIQPLISTSAYLLSLSPSSSISSSFTSTSTYPSSSLSSPVY